ncbi:hypothetical protein E2C00_32515 [Streptomyces sp. WAC05374]|uniref:hypothetical protein n=1 Tax=Streptomyces sp. WAC05374 TaxID=2487420 RepID=UPI000F89AC8F|nr:hypothetical protein [Streptomyces sp. WAC05374]RST19085.1 hypothetical protein EF905_02910 [Streptomyces sp. WAC05374]TDF36947.1 hypothetical protein E2B92_30165 [Streptomyces sp. WAC05374]TDF46442.1 hypothetical protein E2C02_31810 [Streptomyces sp. WAC05374]TDF47543.1 hypothetical protein E2C00_32515 [Streptomyces sp. WAC05374]
MRRTVALCALLVAVLSQAGCSVLEPDYPSGDPARLTQRLTDRAQWAYDAMDLPPHKAVNPSHVTPGYNCNAGGFTIDEMAPDVVTYGLRWTVEDVPADVARATEARLRRQFTAADWSLTHDGNRRVGDHVEFGFRFEDPATGDMFDLRWNNSTTSLFLSGYTPCARIPRSEADTPSPRTWTPRAS